MHQRVLCIRVEYVYENMFDIIMKYKLKKKRNRKNKRKIKKQKLENL